MRWNNSHASVYVNFSTSSIPVGRYFLIFGHVSRSTQWTLSSWKTLFLLNFTMNAFTVSWAKLILRTTVFDILISIFLLNLDKVESQNGIYQVNRKKFNSYFSHYSSI